MKTKKNSRKAKKNNDIPYPIPLASPLEYMAVRKNMHFSAIYQTPKVRDNKSLVRSNWRYPSSKRTLKC